MSQQTALRKVDGVARPEPQGGLHPQADRTIDDGGGNQDKIEHEEHDPMIGRTLEGRYTILARLGAGSMGTVYRAKQHTMGREVAIKILRSDRALEKSAKARFLREARANSLLASPNTVTVFDFGQSKTGEFYLAMELLEGESLGQRLARVGRLPVDFAIDATRQALRSLSEAHAKGIVHRDLKPDNLFFARVLSGALIGDDSRTTTRHEEIVKVVDFGIAKMLRDGDGPMNVVETQAGTVFGTPRYMSPEQAQGKPLDARSDLYSLGVILYQMVTGRPPFTDDDAIVVMARHIKTAPKLPSEACPEASIPAEVEAQIMRVLAKDPADRPESAEVMAADLLRAVESYMPGTSGVRAMITNAAGIVVPESMRPPVPSIAPAAPAASGVSVGEQRLWMAAGAVGILAMAVVAFFLVRGQNAQPAMPTTRLVPSATLSVAHLPRQLPTAPASPETPTISVDALPRVDAKGAALPPNTGQSPPTATPTSSPGAAPPTASGGSRKAPLPATSAKAAPSASAASAAPAPKYGTLDP